MRKILSESTKEVIDNYRIHALLISILVLICVPPFLVGNEVWMNRFIRFNFLMIIASCFLIIRDFRTSRIVGIISLILIMFDVVIGNQMLTSLSQIGISYMIIHAFMVVLRKAMSVDENSENLILVSITGYLIIGLLGGFLAAGLAYLFPESYIHTAAKHMELYNYIYYSFVTTTTLGYGDIVPADEKSQALALLLVISGQLFLTVIIAMNIAKFMQKPGKG